jgi:S1-C subfamily serine protease
MSNALTTLSDDLSAAVERAAPAVVQVSGRRRPAAGVIFGTDLVLAPARAVGDDTAVIRLSTGETKEGQVLGHAIGMGVGVIRVPALGLPPAETGPEPRVGALVVAVGRTWSGAVMATVTNVAVVGGPLRTGRASEIGRVIRLAQAPHGALTGGALADGEGRIVGLVTAMAIRGTTVVIPATLAWEAGNQIVQRGGTRQGYLGISTIPVALSTRQQAGQSQEGGLLITAVADQSPAAAAGVLVGDIVLAFAGEPVHDAETLLTLLRGDHVGKAITLTVLRGVQRHDIAAVVGERPSRRD